MSDLISREELYEKAAELEAAALDYVGRLIERDGGEPSVEWKIWSAILTERTAFKYDIFDAPSAQQWIPVSERLPDELEEVIVTWVNHNPEPYYDSTKDKPFVAAAVSYKKQWFWSSSTCVDYLAEYGRNDMCKVDDDIEITAWMPLPDPYKPK